jgi:hypothetical protein
LSPSPPPQPARPTAATISARRSRDRITEHEG